MVHWWFSIKVGAGGTAWQKPSGMDSAIGAAKPFINGVVSETKFLNPS
jgi:hypothetical protein